MVKKKAAARKSKSLMKKEFHEVGRGNHSLHRDFWKKKLRYHLNQEFAELVL